MKELNIRIMSINCQSLKNQLLIYIHLMDWKQIDGQEMTSVDNFDRGSFPTNEPILGIVVC